MQDLGMPLTILTYVLAVGVGFLGYYLLTKIRVSKANVDAAKIVEEATVKADNIVIDNNLNIFFMYHPSIKIS